MLNFSKKIKLVTIFFISLVILTACISIKDDQPVVKGELGVHKSVDQSESWQTKNAVLNIEAEQVVIAGINVNKIIMDPSDRNALFLATEQGLFYSFSGGDGWQKVDLFAAAPINDIAIDYFDKCNIFVTAGQSIYRSEDCLRNWQEVYFDSRAGLQITEIETENFNQNVVYAATNKGEVLKSVDSGKTWQTIKRLNNPIKQILIDKDDTRIVYIATERTGLYKTKDGGVSWSDDNKETDLNKSLNEFYDSKVFHRLVQDMTKKDTLILASKFGLLRTSDGGMTWESIELITPERGANIFSIAIDPKNANNIYYGTDTTIYKSNDGGENWATQKSPTGGVVNFLLIDPEDPKIMYLGGRAIKK